VAARDQCGKDSGIKGTSKQPTQLERCSEIREQNWETNECRVAIQSLAEYSTGGSGAGLVGLKSEPKDPGD
jgi:hypothetical protein